MKSTLHLLAVAVILVFSSCQKGVDWTGVTLPSSGGGTPGTGGGGGSSNGDLLVKAISVNTTTNDSTTATYSWNSAKKLTRYTTVGKASGFTVGGDYQITRGTDGRIQKIFSIPVTGGFPGMSIDSIVYDVVYQGTTTKLQYVLTSTYSSLMDTYDSTVYTYNASNRVEKKETYREAFIGTTMDLVGRETYTYDGSGNIISVSNLSADPVTGLLVPAGSTTLTYATQKAPFTVGEEAFIFLAPENYSLVSLKKKIQTGTAGGGSTGITMTADATIQQSNSFGRPTKMSVSITPTPPGYTANMWFYYQ